MEEGAVSKTFRYPLVGTVVHNRAGVGAFSFGSSTWERCEELGSTERLVLNPAVKLGFAQQ